MNAEAVALLRQQPPGEAVIKAIAALFANGGHLLELDANERSISFCLAGHLQDQFPDMLIDCEYNRDGIEPKKLPHLNLQPDKEDEVAKTVFPDIIVHKRGTKSNYLLIEMKKSTNRASRGIDYAKLRGYKRILGFQFALFLEIGTGAMAGAVSGNWIAIE